MAPFFDSLPINVSMHINNSRLRGASVGVISDRRAVLRRAGNRHCLGVHAWGMHVFSDLSIRVKRNGIRVCYMPGQHMGHLDVDLGWYQDLKCRCFAAAPPISNACSAMESPIPAVKEHINFTVDFLNCLP